jgi:hypothetical protein
MPKRDLHKQPFDEGTKTKLLIWCHPLISQTRKALEQEKPDERGILRSTQKGILNVTVSRASLHRALRIMQAVLTAAESRDWSFITRKEEASCAIKIGDDEMGVRISERVKRFEIPREKPPPRMVFQRVPLRSHRYSISRHHRLCR